jgi:hypothetical protein|tara:strand:- start:57 stop:539 length:483 start_codon:yes stop_codon:yes gene_type:complete
LKKLFENWKRFLKEGHYGLTKDAPLPIKEIAANWSGGEKPYDEKDYHALYPLEDLLEYREFNWMEEGEQKTPEEWNKLLQDVRKSGIIEPIVVHIGINGQARIAEGNHRLAIAQQVNLAKVPVKFVFLEDEVRKASKMTLEPAEIQTPPEDMHGDSYYMR